MRFNFFSFPFSALNSLLSSELFKLSRRRFIRVVRGVRVVKGALKETLNSPLSTFNSLLPTLKIVNDEIIFVRGQATKPQHSKPM